MENLCKTGDGLRPWSKSETKILEKLAEQGCTRMEISAALPGRTYDAVNKRAKYKDILIKHAPQSNRGRRKEKYVPKSYEEPIQDTVTLRKCMNHSECGRMVASEGPHHRLCERCRQRGDLAEGWEMVV